MVRIKTCRLTRNPQLGDPVAWLGVAVSGASVSLPDYRSSAIF